MEKFLPPGNNLFRFMKVKKNDTFWHIVSIVAQDMMNDLGHYFNKFWSYGIYFMMTIVFTTLKW